MKSFAVETERVGRQSPNPVIEDPAVLSAQYRLAYAAALPTYRPADDNLNLVATRSISLIYAGCKFTE